MFKKMWTKIKEVLAKVGLINSLQKAGDVSKLLIDSDFYNNIANWEDLYQDNPPWQKYHWHDVSGNYHNRNFMSLQMPKILAKKMSNLVFNKKANILVTEKNLTTDDPDNSEANLFIHKVLDDNYFYNNFERHLEYMYATGGMVIRTYVYEGQVKIRFATADSFFPISQDENGVSECVIVSKFVKSGKYYTLLEWHLEDSNNYKIKNELYESINNGDDLGVKIPLSIIYGNELKPESNYPKDIYSRPTFVYLKPNLANNFDLDSPLGISIYANAVDTLHEIDQAYDMLMQEMKMGRRRIIAPDWMLKPRIDPKTGEKQFLVNFEDEVFQTYHAERLNSNAGSQKPEDITLGLRNTELIQTVNSLLDILAAQTGFSAGTFSYNNTQGLETATGVISRNSDTYQSKNSHETILEDGLSKLITIILELGKASKIYQGDTDVDIAINFDDSIAQDRTENAKYYQMLAGDKPLMPQKEAIKRANDLTDSTAEEWYQSIKDEEAQGDMSDILDNNASDGDPNESATVGN